MGENHVHAVSDHPALELDTVVDIDAERAKKMSQRYGANRYATEYEEVLPDIDAAVVATPESVHAEQAHAVLDHDIHLLLEKPITESLEKARELADRTAEADVTTGVSFVLRYDPGYVRAREAAVSGELGDIVCLRAKRGIPIGESRRLGARGHPLFYMSIHDIDMLRWCVGEPVKRVSGTEHRGELADIDVPDATQSLLEFENGTTAVLEGYGTLPADTPGGLEAALEITGTDGTAAVTKPGHSLTVHGDTYDRPDIHHWPVVNDRIDGTVRRQIARFVESIHGTAEMVATIEDGFRTQAVAHAIQRATEEGRPVSVE